MPTSNNPARRRILWLVRAIAVVALIIGTAYVWIVRLSDESSADASIDSLRQLLVDKAEEVKGTYGDTCAEVITSDFLEEPLAIGADVTGELPTELATLIDNTSTIGRATDFVQEQRSIDRLTLASETARRSSIDPEKLILMEAIEVRKFGAPGNSRWEIIRTEALYPCDSDGTPRGLWRTSIND